VLVHVVAAERLPTTVCSACIHAGSYRGLSPTNQVSQDYGIMQITTDRSTKLTDVTIWRAGFAEEREVLVSVVDHCDFSAATSAHAELGHSLTERPLTARCLEQHIATPAA